MKSLLRSVVLRSLCVLSVAACVVAPQAAHAQATSIRIAVVNPARIFNEASETKTLKAKFEEDQKRIQVEGTSKAEELRRLTAGRDEFKHGTPQWREANDKLIRANAEFQVWKQSEQIRADWAQKDQMRTMFEKIQQTIAKVAQRDGIDVVVADIGAKLPENLDGVNIMQLNDAILKKTVLYVSNKPGLDITSAVLLQLDADYKANGAPAAQAVPAAGK